MGECDRVWGWVGWFVGARVCGVGVCDRECVGACTFAWAHACVGARALVRVRAPATPNHTPARHTTHPVAQGAFEEDGRPTDRAFAHQVAKKAKGKGGGLLSRGGVKEEGDDRSTPKRGGVCVGGRE